MCNNNELRHSLSYHLFTADFNCNTPYLWMTEWTISSPGPLEHSRQNAGPSSGWEGCGCSRHGRNMYATNIRRWALPDYVPWLPSEATSSANQLRSLVKVADRDQAGVTPFRGDHYFFMKTAAVTRTQELKMWEICWINKWENGHVYVKARLCFTHMLNSSVPSNHMRI